MSKKKNFLKFQNSVKVSVENGFKALSFVSSRCGDKGWEI